MKHWILTRNPFAAMHGFFISLHLQQGIANASAQRANRINAYHTNTTDIPTHLKTIQQEWKKRGLSFVDDDKIRLVSVVLHDQFSETDNSLMIGHVGVMLPTSDAVYFVEKVAFQEPYRLLKFKNRTELSDYLMLKYDNSWGQDTAHTFILENSDLMDGWRILEEQENAS